MFLKKSGLMIAALTLTFSFNAVLAQHEQLGDPDFDPPINKPAYAVGQGPKVLVDAAHYNWHTIDGRMQSFGKLLAKDGYVVESLTEKLNVADLSSAKILVISNPVNELNNAYEKWNLPTPSAFTPAEIEALLAWINKGGSLLLIADHLPWPGATQALASHFGIIMNNGFAFRNTFFSKPTDPAINLIKFWRDGEACVPGVDKSDVWCYGDGYLREHPIMHGRDPSESIPFVTSFTGQGFTLQANSPAKPVMVLGKNVTQLLPSREDVISPKTPFEEIAKIPSVASEGMLQGATLSYGAGRVAVFGEAAMFSAQVSYLAGPDKPFKMGMNNENAPHNPQFALNVIRWLDGLLPEYNKKACQAEPARVRSDNFRVTVPCAVFDSPFNNVSISFDMLYKPSEADETLFSVENVKIHR